MIYVSHYMCAVRYLNHHIVPLEITNLKACEMSTYRLALSVWNVQNHFFSVIGNGKCLGVGRGGGREEDETTY